MQIKMNYPKQRNSEFSNKLGKWLALKLWKKKGILKLQEENTVITDNVKYVKSVLWILFYFI